MCRHTCVVPLLASVLTASGQFAGPFPIPSKGAASGLQGFGTYMQCRTTHSGMVLDAYAVAVDAHRTWWVALEDGLLRMDGDRHRLYQHALRDTASLPNNTVTDVRVAPDGSVWCGTQAGAARLDPSTGRVKRHLIIVPGRNPVRTNRVWQLAPMHDGAVVAMTEEGVFRLREGRTPEPVAGAGDRGEVLSPDRITHRALLADPDGRAVFIPARTGIVRVGADGSVHSLHDLGLPAGTGSGRPMCLTWAAPGVLLWFDEDTRTLHEAHLRTGKVRHWGAGALVPAGEQLRLLHVDHLGQLWAATWGDRLRVQLANGGVAEVFPDRRTAMSAPGRLAVRSMMRDDEQRLWTCTSQGLLALLPNDARVSTIDTPMLPPGAYFTFLLPTAEGGAIAGTYLGGLLYKNAHHGPWQHLQHTPGTTGTKGRANFLNSITSALAMADGRYLIGSFAGLWMADLPRGRILTPAETEALLPGATQESVAAMARGHDGSIWVATHAQGLARYAPGNDVQWYRHIPGDPTSLPNDKLLCLLVAHDGTLWVGANNGGGVCRFLPESGGFERIPLTMPNDAGIAMEVVRAMAEDDQGHIWIGTHKGGAFRLDPTTRTVEAFDRTRGTPGDLVRTVFANPELGVWLGGRGGLARWNAVQRVFQPSGLRVEWDEELTGLTAYDGALCAANGRHLLRLQPDAGDQQERSPAPRLLELRVNGQPVDASEHPRLQRGRDRLTIDFALQDPIRAQTTRLAYRLSGLMEDWEDCLGCRSVAYNDLPAGDYRFEVRTLSPAGDWTESTTLATLSVRPPFHATWWFRIAVVLVLAAAIVLGFRIYLHNRLRQQREALERERAVLAERMRIASDMHDDLGAGLSGLKLRSEMALRMEQDPAKRDLLRAVADGAGELITGMRQIIWTMNEDQRSLEDLVVYASSYARNYCAHHGLAIAVDDPGQWPPLPLTAEQRRNLLLVVKEALHNTVKHAQASEVRLAFAWNGALHVTIADNGIGLLKGAEESMGNGLRNMRRRVEGLGGTFSMNGTGGTTVRFSLPLPDHNQRSIGA